jgi:hypothetical protein
VKAVDAGLRFRRQDLAFFLDAQCDVAQHVPIVAAALRSPSPFSFGTMTVSSVRSTQRRRSTEVGSSIVVRSTQGSVELEKTRQRQRLSELHGRAHHALGDVRNLGAGPCLPYVSVRVE